MRVRVNTNHKVYFGSRIYSEGDVIDAPDIVANGWILAGRVRHVVRSKPVRAPEGVKPEPSPQVKTKAHTSGGDGPV